MEKIKMLLIDDQPMMIEGLKSALSDLADMQVTGTALTASDALAFLQCNPVDIVLTDIKLPDMSGVEVCKQIKSLVPQVKVLAFTSIMHYESVTEMMRNGAWGYILKNVTQKELIEAIYSVKNNKKYFSAEVTEILLHHSTQPVSTVAKLTPREKEVLQLIAQGFTNQEIADKLFISILTVISHRKNLMTKFEAVNTAALMRIVAKHGLV